MQTTEQTPLHPVMRIGFPPVARLQYSMKSLCFSKKIIFAQDLLSLGKFTIHEIRIWNTSFFVDRVHTFKCLVRVKILDFVVLCFSLMTDGPSWLLTCGIEKIPLQLSPFRNNFYRVLLSVGLRTTCKTGSVSEWLSESAIYQGLWFARRLLWSNHIRHTNRQPRDMRLNSVMPLIPLQLHQCSSLKGLPILCSQTRNLA